MLCTADAAAPKKDDKKALKTEVSGLLGAENIILTSAR